ncbi:hypothetical protein SAMN04488102_11613 [Alkalibacterium subtropicum]|uniref:Uncharacterized protein n=1 Tax=Alkalibacterium subtropicum TaxID=753702 RepID=A0A1I1KYC6_9LACT|nr:hypothetical protein SAMN04488102_11613 [Alkalibacterium subtropicum]
MTCSERGKECVSEVIELNLMNVNLTLAVLIYTVSVRGRNKIDRYKRSEQTCKKQY